MLFYSDIELGDPHPTLGDTGFAGNLGTGNTFASSEIGPENGTNGFDYRPGGVPYPQNNEYVGIGGVSRAGDPRRCWALASRRWD